MLGAEEDAHNSVPGAPAEVRGDVMNHMASDAALVTTDADTVNCELEHKSAELRKPAIVTVLCSPNTHSAVKTGSKKGMVLSFGQTVLIQSLDTALFAYNQESDNIFTHKDD